MASSVSAAFGLRESEPNWKLGGRMGPGSGLQTAPRDSVVLWVWQETWCLKVRRDFCLVPSCGHQGGLWRAHWNHQLCSPCLRLTPIHSRLSVFFFLSFFLSFLPSSLSLFLPSFFFSFFPSFSFFAHYLLRHGKKMILLSSPGSGPGLVSCSLLHVWYMAVQIAPQPPSSDISLAVCRVKPDGSI